MYSSIRQGLFFAGDMNHPPYPGQAAKLSSLNRVDPFEGYQEVLQPHLDLDLLRRGNAVPSPSKL